MNFEMELMQLLDSHAETPVAEIISALELALMAKREQQAEEEG